jgi:predicted amino acid-binding ACT domain protein
MAKRAEDDTPGMGARAGFSDGLAMLFRMLQGVTNISVWMVDHFFTFTMIVDLVRTLYHYATVQRSHDAAVESQMVHNRRPVRSLAVGTKRRPNVVLEGMAHRRGFPVVSGVLAGASPLIFGVRAYEENRADPRQARSL